MSSSHAGLVDVREAVPGCAWVTVDRPDKRNAFDWEMLDAFHRAIDVLESTHELRVAIVRSALPKVFIAGGDIAVMRDLTLEAGTRFVYAGHRLMRRLEESPVVFIAAVGGYALGGGTELILACDLAIAGRSAVFGLPETRLGLFPGWGGTQRLSRAVGQLRAKELIYTARHIPAEEAERIGLVCRVVDDDALEDDAVALAGEIRRNSPTAVVHAKRSITQGTRVSLDQGLVIEAEAWLGNLQSPHRVEGLSAFLEKREPNYAEEAGPDS